MKPVLYLDHDVHLYFVAALRRRGYEASTTQEHGNQRLSDAEQLAFAAERDWTILSQYEYTKKETNRNGEGKDQRFTVQYEPCEIQNERAR